MRLSDEDGIVTVREWTAIALELDSGDRLIVRTTERRGVVMLELSGVPFGRAPVALVDVEAGTVDTADRPVCLACGGTGFVSVRYSAGPRAGDIVTWACPHCAPRAASRQAPDRAARHDGDDQ